MPRLRLRLPPEGKLGMKIIGSGLVRDEDIFIERAGGNVTPFGDPMTRSITSNGAHLKGASCSQPFRGSRTFERQRSGGPVRALCATARRARGKQRRH